MSTCVGVDARGRLVEESAACAAGLLLAALAAGPDEDDAPGVGRRSGSRDMVLLGGDGAFRFGSSEPVAPA